MQTRTLITFLLVLFPVSFLYSQSNKGWKLIDLELEEAPTFNLLFFVDSLRGYGGEQGEYYPFGTPDGRTDNGGQSWNLAGIPKALPLQFYGDIGYTQRGQVSRDNGWTWESLTPTFTDTGYSVFLGMPGAGTYGERYAIVYDVIRNFDHDSLDSPERVRANRLVWTAGGGDWEFADTLLITSFSPFQAGLVVKPNYDPYPAGTDWGFVVGWEDTNTFLVMRSGGSQWLGRFDIEADTSEWIELPPMWTSGIAFRFTDYSFMQILPDKTLVAVSPVSPSRNEFRLSIDGGYRWRKLELPDWLDTETLRFLDSTTVISSNGRTRDGGTTWERFGNVWWTYPVSILGNPGTHYGFFPIDSNSYAIGRDAIFARSDDGGRTWRRNRPATTLYSFIARDGLALMSRDGRMILRSGDNGETWEDIGATTGLPEYVRKVGSLVFADTMNEPDRIFGLAEFSTYDNEHYAAVIESMDGGRTWIEGERIPELGKDAVGASLFVAAIEEERVLFVASDSGVIASYNDGMTWSKRTEDPFDSLFMLGPDNGIGIRTIHSRRNSSVRFARTANGWGSSVDVLPLSDTVRSMAGLSLIDGSILRGCVVTSDSTRYLITSDDGGETWRSEVTSWFPNGEYHWIDTQTVYVFSNGEQRLYYSDDGGRSYRLIHDLSGDDGGAFTLSVRDNGYLYIAGNGTWLGRRTLTPDSLSTVTTTNPSSGGLSIVDVTMRESTLMLHYRADKSAHLTIALHDRLGREIARRSIRQVYSTGCERFDVDELPSGLYFIGLIDGTGNRFFQPVYKME